MIADVIQSALDAGQDSVKRGPDLLPVLREAGRRRCRRIWIDRLAGGHSGRPAWLRAPALGTPRAARVPIPSTRHRPTATHEFRGDRQRTGAAGVHRDARAARRLGARRRQPTTLKVHVHADDPDAATASSSAGTSGASTSPICSSRSTAAADGCRCRHRVGGLRCVRRRRRQRDGGPVRGSACGCSTTSRR